MANIGKSISIKGDLSGEEDLVIEGKTEGRIELPSNELTVGETGSANAEIHAKTVVVIGTVNGNVDASERIEVQATGVVNGDVSAPRLVVQEGAVLNGKIDMGSKRASAGGPLPKPAPAAAAQASAPEKKALG